ncbi:MAG: methylated-DNA--[protein]-cysteine S-methyltransferase [Desulfobacterales bacterium]
MPAAHLAARSRHYPLIEAAIGVLARQPEKELPPEAVARELGWTPARLREAAERWSGVAPGRLFPLLTPGGLGGRRIKPADLRRRRGAGGAGWPRVRLAVIEKMPPRETLRCGYHATPFGGCLLGVLGERICWLSFREGKDLVRARRELCGFWRGAWVREDEAATAPWIPVIFDPPAGGGGPEIPVAVRGTPFQVAVWKALLSVPPGAVSTYAALARAAGRPRAARAAGSAVGANPVSFLIPCHRIVPQGGGFGNYGGGVLRKRALLAWEALHFPAP